MSHTQNKSTRALWSGVGCALVRQYVAGALDEDAAAAVVLVADERLAVSLVVRVRAVAEVERVLLLLRLLVVQQAVQEGEALAPEQPLLFSW